MYERKHEGLKLMLSPFQPLLTTKQLSDLIRNLCLESKSNAEPSVRKHKKKLNSSLSYYEP